jgi:hypothetical protein
LLNKTGGGEIPDSKRIGKFEQIALDYVGVEGVVGKSNKKGYERYHSITERSDVNGLTNEKLT